MAFNLLGWLRQPTTIIGIGTGIGTIAHALALALAHQANWPVTAGGVVFALVCMVIPDNTTAQADARKAAVDLTTAAQNKNLADMAPTLFADAAALARDIAPVAPKA